MTFALNQNILFQSIFSMIQINLVELKTKKAKIAEIKTNVLKIAKKKINGLIELQNCVMCCQKYILMNQMNHWVPKEV